MAKLIRTTNGRRPMGSEEMTDNGRESRWTPREGWTRKIMDGGTGPASRGGTRNSVALEKELRAKQNNRLNTNATFGKGSRDLKQDVKDVKNSFRVGRHIDTTAMETASNKRAVAEAKASDERFATSQRFYADNKALRDKRK